MRGLQTNRLFHTNGRMMDGIELQNDLGTNKALDGNNLKARAQN